MNSELDLNPEERTGEGGRTAAAAGIIDVHHHILPPEYIKALADMGVTKSIGVSFPPWSPEKDLKLMDRLGVKLAVASFSTPAANVPDTADARSLARLCNELIAAMVRARPDRYGAFATMPPLTDTEGVLKELDYALDTLKLDGVELMTNYALKYLGDSSFEKVYEALNAKKAVVHIHPNDPPGVQLGVPAAVMDAPFDTTRTAFSLICSGVMERYPHITFILSHGGGTLPYLSFRMGAMAPFVWKSFGQNAPKGFDEYLGRFYYDTAIVSPDAFPYLVKQAGAARVMAGTDYPFAGSVVPTQCLAAVRRGEGIDDREREAVLERNALALFPGLGRLRD